MYITHCAKLCNKDILLNLFNKHYLPYEAYKKIEKVCKIIHNKTQVIMDATEELSVTYAIEILGFNNPKINFKKNFMAPFYGWGSTALRLEPLRGGSLLFTTKFPEIPGTHFIDLGRMKG